MGNCLVTKLKESVSNTDLLKIDEIEFNFDNASDATLGIKYNDGTIPFDSYTASDGLTVTQSSDTYTLVVSGTGKIRFSNKYHIYRIDATGETGFDPEVLKYLPITYLYFVLNTVINITTEELAAIGTLIDINLMNTYEHSSGNISSLLPLKNQLNTLILIRCGVVGTMSDYGKFANLTNINLIGNTGFSGTIEDFVTSRRTVATQATGSVTCSGDFNFNGVDKYVENKTLSWTASTITFDGETIDV